MSVAARERRVNANAERLGAPQLVVERELVRTDTGVLHARNAATARDRNRRSQRGKPIVLRRPRQQRRHQAHRALFEHAGRFARARVLHDDAVRGIGGAPRHARELQRLRVGPAAVTVIRRQIRRPIGHERIEELARGQSAAERVVVPAAAGHPGAIGIERGPCADRLFDRGQRLGVEQVDLAERQAAAQEMACARH